MQQKHLDVRTRHKIRELRSILRLRMNVLEKDIGREKRGLAEQALDELSLTQLNKLRNVNTNIADEILATFNRNAPKDK